MASTLPVDDVVPALAETAGRTTHSTRAEVRLLFSDGEPWSQVWPERATADGSPVTVDVRHAGTAVGEIEVDLADAEESPRDRMLLDDLARPAGLALSTVRLTVELRRRAAELEDLTAVLASSYRRIADARRTEAERIRAEMQDRVMPHLDRAQAVITGDLAHRADSRRIDQAREDVAEALDALRTLARGIYPPRLADAGLAVSLEGWWQRSGIAIDLQIRGDQEALHVNIELESCLYFCLVTALGELDANGEGPAAALDIGAAEVGLRITGAIRSTSVQHSPAMMAVRDRVDAFGGRFEIAVQAPEPATGSTGPDGDETSTHGTDPAGGPVDAGTASRVTLRAWIPLVDPAAPTSAAFSVTEKWTERS
jgi:hypothetical protein